MKKTLSMVFKFSALATMSCLNLLVAFFTGTFFNMWGQLAVGLNTHNEPPWLKTSEIWKIVITWVLICVVVGSVITGILFLINRAVLRKLQVGSCSSKLAMTLAASSFVSILLGLATGIFYELRIWHS